MVEINPEYIVNSEGTKTKVLLSYQNYLEIIRLSEDLHDSLMIDNVKNESEISLVEYKRKCNLV